MRWFPALLLLSACPQDIDAAAFRPGDGGVWVGAPDGGITFVDDSSDLPGGEKLKPLPDMETLCMLTPGDWSERNDYEKRQGIWIDDIQDSRFLGPVPPNSKNVSSDAAQMRYTYQRPTGSPGEKVSITLGFENMIVVDVMGADIYGDGTAKKGTPWKNPWFLNRIDVTGMDPLLCWHPFYRNSTEYHWVPCNWCKRLGVDFLECKADDPKECFY